MASSAAKTLALLLPVLLLISCANWRPAAHRTLDSIQQAGVELRKTVGKEAIRRCQKIADACSAEGKRYGECLDLLECHEGLGRLSAGLKGIQSGYIQGKIAIREWDEGLANEIIAKTSAILAELHAYLKSIGVLK